MGARCQPDPNKEGSDMPFAVLILPAILLVGCCLAWIIGEGPARSEWTAAMAELENEGPNDS